MSVLGSVLSGLIQAEDPFGSFHNEMFTSGEDQFELAKIYEHGKGVSKDENLALYWLSKAAENGHCDAYYELGKVAETPEISYYFYSKAISQCDHDQAYYEMGMLYYSIDDYGNIPAYERMKIAQQYFSQSDTGEANYQLGLMGLFDVENSEEYKTVLEYMLVSDDYQTKLEYMQKAADDYQHDGAKNWLADFHFQRGKLMLSNEDWKLDDDDWKLDDAMCEFNKSIQYGNYFKPTLYFLGTYIYSGMNESSLTYCGI
ncbi:MAG: tetratricopeptide repeat protein [Candidatus Comchoanobacterales bacterium]